MYCEACGREIANGTRICPYCLAKQSIYHEAPAQTEATPHIPAQPAPGVDTQTETAPPFSAEAPKTEQPQNAYVVYQNDAPNAGGQESDKTRPLGTWAFFGYSLLFGIPLVGFVLQIVFSCIDTNLNIKHFARSRLLLAAFWFVLYVVLCLLFVYFLYKYGDSYDSFYGGDSWSPFMDEYIEGFQYNF